jgi:hypothetical protein
MMTNEEAMEKMRYVPMTKETANGTIEYYENVCSKFQNPSQKAYKIVSGRGFYRILLYRTIFSNFSMYPLLMTSLDEAKYVAEMWLEISEPADFLEESYDYIRAINAQKKLRGMMGETKTDTELLCF